MSTQRVCAFCGTPLLMPAAHQRFCNNYCRRQGDKALRPHSTRVSPQFWVGVNWSLPTSEIVKLTGCGASTVKRWRDKINGKAEKNLPFDWETVNWRRSNERIRQQTGKSLTSIKRHRRELAPETICRRGRPITGLAARLRANPLR